MTEKEYQNRLAEIKKQEETLGVKIELYPIDKDHLDCTFYGGEVGSITYPDGWKLVIEAHGDIRLMGNVKGHGEVYINDTSNSGSVMRELGNWLNDKKLHELLKSDDEENSLYFNNNNWFEVNAVTPQSVLVDLFDADNVIDDCLLDAFEDVEGYKSLLQYAKEIQNRLAAHGKPGQT